MPAARLRAEVPPVVTALVGIVVAVVSAVFGISAHGLAAGPAAVVPDAGQILMVIAAGAAVGAASAARARTRSPLAIAGAGLIAGQALVHMVLSSGHTHAAAGHAATGHGALGHHAVDAAAVRAAMDGAAPADAAPDAAALLTPGMLGAHLGAIVVTLALVAVLSSTLSWVAARVLPLLVATGHVAVVVDLLHAARRVTAPDAGYLLARGGMRAPPVAV